MTISGFMTSTSWSSWISAPVTGTRTTLGNAQFGGVPRMHANGNLLEVQQDVDDIFLDTFNASVLMQYAIDLCLDDCRTRHRRQQDASQRVAKRVAVAAFERLDSDHFGVTGRSPAQL